METVKIEIGIYAPLQQVWVLFTEPHHVQRWFYATKNWRCSRALNELKKGGSFSYRMEHKDGNYGYDFTGTIDDVSMFDKIISTLQDGRNLEFYFEKIGNNSTQLSMIFVPETFNTKETQVRFWNVVLNNFEKYVENAPK